MAQTPVVRVPVSLQGVDANVSAWLGHIRVKNFGEEEAFRGL